MQSYLILKMAGRPHAPNFIVENVLLIAELRVWTFHNRLCLSFVKSVVVQSRSDTNRTGAEGLSFYYLRLLHFLNQMLAVVLLSQHRVSSSKTVRPRAPCGARCIRHAVRTWSAVCSEAPHLQFGEGARPICAWTNGIAQHQFAGG